MSSNFVHLHLHTQYSLLQGSIFTDGLFDKVKALGMDAVAMTDTHNLFGAIDFYTSAKDAGVKPIIGCEVNFLPEGKPLQGSVPVNNGLLFHLTLLCKDLAGYQNLCKMISRSYMDTRAIQLSGAKVHASLYRPVVDRAMLAEFGQGLIVMSGCLKSELAYKILMGKEQEAYESAEWFKKKFGSDFYLELVDGALPEQERVNETLYGWQDKLGVKCVGTADCHYLEAKDANAHEVLQCIEQGRNLDLDRPKSLVPAEYFLKKPEAMRQALSRFPGAYEATQEIAAKCDLKFRFKDDQGRQIYHLPNFRPEGVPKDAAFDLIAFFKEESRKGLRARFETPEFQEKAMAPNWAEEKPRYEARLEEELAMIERTGFAGYFLIVADFINWAKRQGIPVGPGRGSGAGSLVAYALNITDIDPIEFKLLFERFINPERISMPDFDVDFCQDRRGEVIEYVTRKYGSDNVCQIITFGKLQARAVIKDVGRVYGLTFGESDQITKLLPQELDITISKALEAEPMLRQRMEQDPKVAKVIETALSLEGLYRNAGMHAAGVIITEEPIVSYCPVFVGRDGSVVTQFDKDFAEKIGLVKYDFLGLKTLTVIDNAIRLIPEKVGFSLSRMNLKDPKVFELLSSGDTDGVFQVESSGMKDLCQRIAPSSLEDITAINALYRPGPLGSGMVDDFIDRKHGRKELAYEVPQLESILRDTYGVILYQEQVMQIARELAGYSLGQADLLRRAMGKKKPEEMAKHREIFVKGAVERGLPQDKAAGIFDLMAKFAEYGFNKSHSAAYGMITYQTAYLKTYYPAEFMAALMTTEMDTTEKLTRYIADARAHGLKVHPPDVNLSQKRFSVHEGSIRFGLEAIKGVGGIAVDALLEARAEGGPFKDLIDFVKRVSTRKVNKKVLESLAIAGAFDSLFTNGLNRPSLVASVEGLIQFAADEQEEKALGQSSLFENFHSEELKAALTPNNLFKLEADWPTGRKLAQEKQVVGFYLSAHPLDTWQRICEEWLGWTIEKLHAHAAKKTEERRARPAADPGDAFMMGAQGFRARPQRPEVRVAGLLVETKEITTKKGSKMAFGTLEDLTGKMEVVFFPEAYGLLQPMIAKAATEAEPLLITGEFEADEEQAKVFVKNLEWVGEAHKGRVTQVTVRLDPSQVQPEQMRALKQRVLAHPGKCKLKIEFVDPRYRTELELPGSAMVAGTPQFVRAVNGIFGREVVRLS